MQLSVWTCFPRFNTSNVFFSIYLDARSLVNQGGKVNTQT
ncbi:hypothetical protein HMPREF1862_01361 [Varibaculum cambriense]|uniref:Uncharacterized protein n=1 Tax=Varibaculum cambriense TaxID=184870 RepID=A0AB34WYQ9_9ACTO|nr:hypothetical protein HMPREF1862_01361 [Varibaculum cambriense]